jgi:hypothetical protein
MGKLKAAEAAEQGPQRGTLAREAVPLLLRVAASCNLEYVCSRLAHLQQWEGEQLLPDADTAAATAAAAAALTARRR